LTTQTEIFDQDRKRYRSGLLVGSIIFLVAWFGYILVRVSPRPLELFHTIVMVVLIVSLLIQAYYAVRTNLLERKIRKDAQLKAALNNELIQLNELKAWRAAFFAMLGFIILTGVFSFFVQIDDLMLVLLTLLLVGFGAHNLAVFLLDR
jgi:hypothetical protein